MKTWTLKEKPNINQSRISHITQNHTGTNGIYISLGGCNDVEDDENDGEHFVESATYKTN